LRYQPFTKAQRIQGFTFLPQAVYVEDFLGAVLSFLAFHGNNADLADRLARAITDHATRLAVERWP